MIKGKLFHYKRTQAFYFEDGIAYYRLNELSADRNTHI